MAAPVRAGGVGVASWSVHVDPSQVHVSFRPLWHWFWQPPNTTTFLRAASYAIAAACLAEGDEGASCFLHADPFHVYVSEKSPRRSRPANSTTCRRSASKAMAWR